MNWPLAVIGFNRPVYLERTLRALQCQQGIDLPGRVALFCDGAVNPNSGERHATDDEIAATIATFRCLWPLGEVFASPVNLGIAANIDRAERWVFDHLEAEAGMFFEDDLVVTPHYLRALDELLGVALEDERIGYVACYGSNHFLPLAAQQMSPTEYMTWGYNWGFGLTRRQYLKSKPYMDDYLALISEMDYRHLDNDAIHALLRTWGIGPINPAQDNVRSAVCCRSGAVRINIRACLGRYIGQVGTHMNSGDYQRAGYGQTVLYPDPVTSFPRLSDAQYQALVERDANWLKGSDRWASSLA